MPEKFTRQPNYPRSAASPAFLSRKQPVAAASAAVAAAGLAAAPIAGRGSLTICGPVHLSTVPDYHSSFCFSANFFRYSSGVVSFRISWSL
jgi:hypothetical protein